MIKIRKGPGFWIIWNGLFITDGNEKLSNVGIYWVNHNLVHNNKENDKCK